MATVTTYTKAKIDELLAGVDTVVTYTDHGVTGLTETIDAATDVHRLELNAATVTISLTGWPPSGTFRSIHVIAVQDSTGGRVFSWPGEVVNPPVLSTGPGDIDVFELGTWDGGATVVVNRGPEGPAGATGADGADGADGAAGPTGPAGADAPATLTITSQSGTSYTLVVADGNTRILFTNAGAITVTIDTHANQALPVGTVIELAQYGAGQITVAAAGGVTKHAPRGSKSAVQYGTLVLVQDATNEWNLSGDATT